MGLAFELRLYHLFDFLWYNPFQSSYISGFCPLTNSNGWISESVSSSQPSSLCLQQESLPPFVPVFEKEQSWVLMSNRLFRIVSLDEFMKLVKRQIKTFRLFRRILIICFLKTVNIYSYWIQAKRLLVKYKSVNNTHSEEGEEDSLTKALWIFSSFNFSGVWVFFSAPKTCGARVLFRSPKCVGFWSSADVLPTWHETWKGCHTQISRIRWSIST